MNREMLFRGKRIDNGEWMPLPEPYKPEDIKETPWKNRTLGDFMKGANR